MVIKNIKKGRLSKKQSKIINQLYLSDKHELEALWGSTEVIEESEIKGYKRLVNCLIMLIDNSYFAVKEDKGKSQLKKYKEELKKIDKIIPLFLFLSRLKLIETKTNQVKKTSELKLIKERYEKVLERVLEIKALINKPLNQNHLIFTDKKEFDPRAFKTGIRKRMIEQG